MSSQRCVKCNYLFEGGDVVRAVILTKWVALKSQACYALERPTECIEVSHVHCNRPKGEPEGD